MRNGHTRLPRLVRKRIRFGRVCEAATIAFVTGSPRVTLTALQCFCCPSFSPRSSFIRFGPRKYALPHSLTDDSQMKCTYSGLRCAALLSNPSMFRTSDSVDGSGRGFHRHYHSHQPATPPPPRRTHRTHRPSALQSPMDARQTHSTRLGASTPDQPPRSSQLHPTLLLADASSALRSGLPLPFSRCIFLLSTTYFLSFERGSSGR